MVSVMTKPENTVRQRVPASLHTRWRLFVLTLIGGFLALQPIVMGEALVSVMVGLLIGLEVALANVWWWFMDTRPGFAGSRPAKVLARAVFAVAGVLLVLFGARLIF